MEWEDNSNIVDFVKMNILNDRVSYLFYYQGVSGLDEDGHDIISYRINPFIANEPVEQNRFYSTIKDRLILTKEI